MDLMVNSQRSEERDDIKMACEEEEKKIGLKERPSRGQHTRVGIAALGYDGLEK